MKNYKRDRLKVSLESTIRKIESDDATVLYIFGS